METQPHTFSTLGGKRRIPDPTEHRVGGVAPYSFVPVLTNAAAFAGPIYYQGQRPACGAHAGTWLKGALDSFEKETPRYTWVNIKRDDSSPSEGTDMPTIFKALGVYGGETFEPLGNNVALDDVDYASVTALTQAMITNGQANLLGTPAYLQDHSFNGIKQAIHDHGYVILLIDVCARFWTAANGQTSWAESDILPLASPSTQFPVIDGHFIVAHSYDENYIYFANSFGPTWGKSGHGYFGVDYMPWVIEAGVAANPPKVIPTTTNTPVASPVIIQLQTQELTLLQKAVQLLKQELNNLLNPSGSAIPNMKPLVYSATFWFSVAKFISGVALAVTTTFPGSKYAGYAVMVESIVALVLRLQTTQAIGSVFPKKPSNTQH